jgi:LCP family protein required for cell wall assembly
MLVTALTVGALFVFLLNPSFIFKVAGGEPPAPGVEDAFDRDRINIALLGFDRNEARAAESQVFRPDTIMIASLNFRTGELALANISRDSYVKISGTEIYDKINHAYMYGYQKPGVEDPHRSGMETTLKTIEDFLGGVPIHYYVAVDMDGVVEIVDTLGGIDYEVEYPIRADFGRGELLLDQGLQHLDGRAFLNYVRDRSVGTDTGRSQRQQQILIAAFSQLKKQGRLKDVPALYRSVKDHLETNLNPAQVASLAFFGLQVDPGEIKTYLFPGTIQGEVSYIVIDEKKRVELIKEIFGVTVAERPQLDPERESRFSG